MSGFRSHPARAHVHSGDDVPAVVPTTDAELLARCRRGDRQAWNDVLVRYERLVFSVAVRNGLDRSDAADVTQSTFLALLDSVDRIKTDDSLPFWLMTVARRHAWRIRDRAQRESAFAEIDVEQPDPILEWVRSRALMAAIAELPPPCRELITALYFDPSQPSYAEIATRMGRAIGGLGPLRGRCLERLRALLGEEHPS